MTPDEIIEAYNVLAQNVNDNAAQEAARIGNAQRSLGTLAERVASPANQTYGLANYTYDRVMRPTVDATAKSLAVQGLAAGLETTLSDALRAAKSRYDNARASAVAGSGGSGGTAGGTNGNSGGTEVTDVEYWGGPVVEPNYYNIGTWDAMHNYLNMLGERQAKLNALEYAHDQGMISDEEYQKRLRDIANGNF